MNKTIKKISAVLLSAAMVASMNLSVSASDECPHLLRTLVNKRLSDHSTSIHTFNLYNSEGKFVRTENCTISKLTFEYDRKCLSCGYIDNDKYYEHQTTHTNVNCTAK